MAKKSLLSKLQQPVHPVHSIIIICLFVISGIIALVIRSNHYPVHPFRQNQFQTFRTVVPRPTDIPNITPIQAPASYTTYTSSKLGISFTYNSFSPIPNGNGQYFYISEIDDKIFLYENMKTNKPFLGTDADFLTSIAPGSKYVEVFNKDPNQSLTDAIKQHFLAGYSQDDCIIKVNRYGHPREDETFQTASIILPVLPENNRAQLEALSNKCPKYSTPLYGVSYFMMDPAHPSKFLFVVDGQDNLPSGVGGLTWDRTIMVLQ
jgi:hypothetical protein